jgi:hypothetical protein
MDMPNVQHPQATSDTIRHDVDRDGTVTKTLVVHTNIATAPSETGFEQKEFDEFLAAVVEAIKQTGSDRAEILGRN